MSADAIDPENIPQFTGDLEQLGTDALLLTAEALVFRQSGTDVHSRFQGLSACYAAPEAEQLFATTAPVAAKADKFADDLEKVGAALSAYETEIRPLVARLKSLKQRAETFQHQIAGDDDWREDDENVQLNNDLVHDVNATTAAFWEAEITCHNKITALVGGTTLILEDGAQKRFMKRGTSTYGFTAGLLDQSEELPWGRTVEKERHGLDWLGHQVMEFGKGFVVDGVWGTIRGLGTLVGVDGWDAAGEAWKGLGKLATGVLVTAVPVVGVAYWTMPEDKLPSYLRDSRNTVKEAGKALVAYDQWGKNPARAGGAVTFNVLTTVFTGGAGAAAKGGAVAGTVGALGKAGRLVDPMTYIGKAAKFGTVKVTDLFAGLRTVHAGTYDDILSGAGRVQPDGSVVRVPVIRDNVLEWPDGTRLNLDDHTVRTADGENAPATVELSARDRELLGESRQPRDPVMAAAHGGSTPEAVGRTGDSGPGSEAGHHSGPSVSSSSDGAAHGGSHGRTAHHPSADLAADGRGHGAATSGSEDPLDGHDGTTPTADHSGADAPHRPLDEIEPERYRRGADTASVPSGPMRPDQEAALIEELTRAKITQEDQARVIHTLSREPFGSDVADLISRGHLRDAGEYNKILSMCKQGETRKSKSMVPAAHMALVHATELQNRGFSRIAFEFEDNVSGLDLDVTTLHADGIPQHGYQLKDVSNISGIRSAAKSAGKQLLPDAADTKVAILDVHQSIADLNAKMLKEVEFQARRAGATFHLRFNDGSVTVPPDSPVFP